MDESTGNTPLTDNKGFLESVNRAKVPAELLIRANELVGEMTPEDRSDLTARTLCIIRMLDDRKLSFRKRGTLVTAISFRLEALARLEKREGKHLGAWRMPGNEPGMVFAHEDLFRTAAVEPLIQKGERVAFDRDSFVKRLLLISKEHGRG